MKLLFKFKIIIGILFLLANVSYAQIPVNDNCGGAINIPIGTPAPCGTGTMTGSSGSVTGNITNATPGNPYIYQTGCSGASATQSFPANDVWYRFTATGYQANINILSQFANPNVAFYSGNCAALGGGIGGCAVGTGGAVSLTVNQLVPGTVYYLQVSGNTGQIGSFTLTMNNNISCAACLVNASVTATPAPINGAYAPGQTVQICFKVSQYNTINTNWFHGVQLALGACWDKPTLTTNIPTAASTSGSWAYYPAGIGVANAVNWTAGWYFDFNPTDGNPKNNFGDLPTTTVTAAMWNFCATVKTSSVCSPGCDLSVTFNTSGDGESGSWSNSGCTNDPPAVFKAIGSCCPPVMSMLPVNCFGTSTGTAVATPVGAAGPYTYVWTGPAAYTSSATAVVGASTITNVPFGTYTVTVTDKNLCSTSNTILVTQPTSVTATPSFTNANCTVLGSAAVVAAGGTPGYTYTWSPSGGNAATASGLSPGTYTVTVSDSKLCQRTATVAVAQTGVISAAFSTPTPTQCLTGNSYVFTAGVLTGTHTYSFNPTAGAPATGNVATYGPVSFTAPGTYTVTHTIVSGVCSNTLTSIVVINPQPTVTANNNSPACVGGSVIFTGTGGGTYAWSGPSGFTSAVQNPTLTPITLANAGTYTVTVNLSGCIGTATTNVTISNPTTSATNTGPYCAGTTIQLNAPAATSYTWSGPGGFTSNLQNPTIAAATLAMSGTYSVTVSLGVCTANATTAVVVNALPTPAATNTGPYCPGNTIQLNVGAFTTYTWTGPSAFASNLQNPTQASAVVSNGGVYTVTVTNANGCVNTSSTTVVVNPTPVPVVGSNSPICLNSTINLTAIGGTGYAWSGPNAFASALQNPTVASATSVNAGVYTVTVTALGCTNTGTVSVTILTPTTTATNAGPFCVGTTIQLNTPAATSYTWSGPGGFTSNLQNPTIASAALTMAGTYSVLVSAGTCTANATTAVVVNALPTPAATNTGPYCPSNTIQLNVGAFTTYTWTGPSAFASNSQNPTQASAVVSNGGVYTVTVADANGCVNTSSTTVVVNPTPVPIVGSNSPVCLSTAINLTATGGTGYAWSGPNAFSSALQNPTVASATAADAGVYTVTVTALGCTNTGTVNVTVLSPTTSASNTGAYCAGTTIQLNTPAATTYNWSGPLGFTSALQNPTIPASTAGMTGVYNVTVSVGTCTAAATTSVTVNALPTPAATNTGPYCSGNTIQLNVGAYNNYAWVGPGAYSDNTQNPTIPNALTSNGGAYIVTVTDANGCINSSTTTVVVNATPIAAASGATVCENFNANISASGGVTYAWSGPNGFTSIVQNPVIASAPLTASGQYTVIVSTAGSCTDVAVANVVINAAPTVSIVTNSPVCINQSLNFSATGGVTYAWAGPNGFTSNLQNPTINATSVSYSGNYIVTVTDINGCTAITNTNAVINPNPVPSITSGPNKGCAPLCVQFTVSSTPAAATANWSFGNNTVANGTLNTSSCYNVAGIYTITVVVSDQIGCTGVATYTAEVYPQPIADFNHAPLKPILNIDPEVVFTDASHGTPIVSWNWYFMNTAQYTSNVQNPIFVYTEPGTYAVALVVKSDKGCTDTIVRPLIVGEDFGIYVPNAFTPNEDGLNDKFQPKGFGIVKYNLKIFDRWGEKLFETSTFEEPWDGTYQGRGNKLCEQATYTWLIELTSVFGKAHELKGHVTLIK